MTSLPSREMTEQEMINTCTAPQMAHLIQVLRQTIRNKDKEIEKWVDIVSQLQRDGELDPPEPKPKKGENMSNHNKETEARCPHCYRHYVEGERAWALYMMRMGHKVTNPMYDNRVYHLPEGGMIHVNGIESIATSQWIDYWCIDVPDGWQLYEEPEPEPEPKPAYAVEDWVEFIDAGGHKSQGKYLSKAYDNAILVRDIIYNTRCVVPTTKITRKLDPSEVIVKIDCLEGTIERHDGNPQYWFKLRSSEYNYALISIDMLDTPTRELVESLLKAQEVRND